MLVSTEGGGAKLHLKRLSLGHYGRLFVSGQRYKHVFEDFKSINITGFSCATKGKCHPELVSGSCQQYIIPTKGNNNNITSTFRTAKRQVKGDFVLQKESETEWLAKQLCHPELRILCRVRTESETRSSANKRECEQSEMNDLFAWNNNPRHVSGSCQQYIIPTKGNNNNITSTFRTAKRQGKGDLVPAFTLAEVLITLGIIGVVAAMTMPTLLQNYQKKVTAVRLKHFSSLMQQANQTYNAQAMIKTVDSLDYIVPNDPNSMMDYFNIYLKPYIKVNEVEKKGRGLLVKLANGTGAYFQKLNDCPLEPNNLTCETYIIFCPNIKYCENINEAATSTSTFGIDGKSSFIMYTSGQAPSEYRINKWSRETLIEAAKDSPYYCSSLIEFDNWEIKDDNPWWE